MAMLVEKERTKEEIEQAVGGTMLDYHLQMLKQAGLADTRGDRVLITDFGKNFMETKSEKPAETKKEKPPDLLAVLSDALKAAGVTDAVLRTSKGVHDDVLTVTLAKGK